MAAMSCFADCCFNLKFKNRKIKNKFANGEKLICFDVTKFEELAVIFCLQEDEDKKKDEKKEEKDGGDKDKEKEKKKDDATDAGMQQAVAAIGIALIAMGEDIGSEMSLRSFGHLVSGSSDDGQS